MADASGRSQFDPDELNALEAVRVSAAAAGRAGRCPDPALVLAAQAGVLDEDAAAPVLTHVEACQACRRAAGDLERALDDPSVPAHHVDARLASARAPFARRGWFWLLPAGALVAAGLIWAVVGSSTTVPDAPELELARADVPLPPSVFKADRPAVTPGEIELTTRGEAAPVSLANRIGDALDRADAGDLNEATALLSRIAGEFPKSRDAQLALGAVLVRNGRAADALAPLRQARAIAGASPDDEAGWFLSIALAQTGARDEARAIVDAICQHGGARGPQACAGLTELSQTPSR